MSIQLNQAFIKIDVSLFAHFIGNKSSAFCDCAILTLYAELVIQIGPFKTLLNFIKVYNDWSSGFTVTDLLQTCVKHVMTSRYFSLAYTHTHTHTHTQRI